MNVELISFTENGGALAAKIAQILTEHGHAAACTRQGLSLEDWTARAFGRADALLFVGAAGIAVRAIAPHIKHKALDPAVVVVDEGGRFAVPILSGHLGGANDLARELADLLDAQSVITTATDVNGVFSFDQWARDMDCAVPCPERIRPVAQKLLAGQTVTVLSSWPILGEPPRGVRQISREDADVQLTLKKQPKKTEHEEKIEKNPLILTPKALFLGVGCRKNISLENLEEAYRRILEQVNLFPDAVKMAATVNIKAEEPALLEFCARHRLPLRAFAPEELAAVEGEFAPSEFVKKITGVDNICQRAAVLASGGTLLTGKLAQNGVTMALAVGKIALKWRK
jgi:cobalt-precorrin 5A hydrolase